MRNYRKLNTPFSSGIEHNSREQITELPDRYFRSPQNGAQRSGRHLASVHRHDDASPVGISKKDVGTALTDANEAGSRERGNKLGGGNDRQFIGH